jgi:hypothetical protein
MLGVILEKKKMTNNLVKSRFKAMYIILFLGMFICSFGLIYMIIELYDRLAINGLKSSIITELFFGFLIILLLKFFSEYKVIRIDRENRKLTFYSPLVPFGKSVDLTQYTGKIKQIEKGFAGSYTVGYLVDNKMITRIRISGLFYKNFDELFSAVGLKEIKDYEFNIWKYYVLLYTGRLKIILKEKKNK